MRVFLAALFAVCGLASAADIPTLGVVIRYADGVMAPTRWMELDRVLFGPGKSVSRFWRENSYGQHNIVGKVYPEVLVASFPITDGRCHAAMASEAKRILAARGVDLTHYQYFVVVHSPGRGCRGEGNGGGGLATTNNNFNPHIIAHELGHAFGLVHSSSLRCLPTGCTSVEYGNPLDNMGGGFGSLTTAQKHVKLWLGGTRDTGPSPDRVITHTAAVGVPVEHTIRRITSYTGPVAVRMPYGTPGANPDQSLWIEYRALFGIDGGDMLNSWLMSEGALLLQNGMMYNTRYCKPCLIDTRPETAAINDAAILPGQSYTHQGYKVETLSLNGDTLTVRVTRL